MHTCVRGSSISCHTVAVPIMPQKVMQTLNEPRYNKPLSVTQQWHKLPYFPAPNLLCLLQYIPLGVNLVHQIIKIPYVDVQNHRKTLTQQRDSLRSRHPKVAPSRHAVFPLPEVMNLGTPSCLCFYFQGEWWSLCA